MTLNQSDTLNQKFKRKWVTALRSGKFKQGSGYLKTKGVQKHCCLGVACAIAGIPAQVYGNKGMPSELPEKYQKMLPPFFRAENSCDREAMTDLSSMNDDGASFEKIADYIEETY